MHLQNYKSPFEKVTMEDYSRKKLEILAGEGALV